MSDINYHVAGLTYLPEREGTGLVEELARELASNFTRARVGVSRWSFRESLHNHQGYF